MVDSFKEAIAMEVVQEIMQTETLDHLSIEDQMMVLDLVVDSLKRYKGIELKNFLDEMDKHYKEKKKNYRYNLSDL
tara:strand:+ start:2619 stop:2846 length:228 start_codon:yes stop_codon:yes gene_type:complete